MPSVNYTLRKNSKDIKLLFDAVSALETQNKIPKDLLIYYGYPNSFNSGVNGWVNEKVAQDMANYNLIILGDGVENPSHPDYANTQAIIPRIKQLNSDCLVFGYVALAQTLANFQTKTDQWDTLQVHGIFIDEAGYDFGKTRSEFNTCVDYVHSKSYSKVCFVNAWNTDHIIGKANDVSYPNTTFNSSLIESNLISSDWILLESFPINTTAYSGSGGYEPKADWYARGQKATDLRSIYEVNFAGGAIIDNTNVSGASLFKYGFISALMYSLNAFGSSDTDYASGSATVTYWSRPDISNLGDPYGVIVDAADSDVYMSYTETAKLLVDFSSGAQLSSIIQRGHVR